MQHTGTPFDARSNAMSAHHSRYSHQYEMSPDDDSESDDGTPMRRKVFKSPRVRSTRGVRNSMYSMQVLTGPEELTAEQKQTLVWFHVCICAAHFSLAIWTLFDGSDWKVPVSTSVVKWKKVDEELGCDSKNTTTGKGNCFVTRENIEFNKLRDISLTELVAGFHFLSFTWQAVVLLSLWAETGIVDFYFREVAKGRNTMRWVEYSLSAPLMTIVIAILLGQMDIVALFLLAVCTWVLMAFGFLHERIYIFSSIRNAEGLVPHITGWLLFCMTWFAIGFPFILSLETSEAKPPAAIKVVAWVVLWVMFSFYASFGIAQIAHSFTSRGKIPIDLIRANFEAEISYNVLSLASKTSLGLLLFWGIRTRDKVLGLEIR